jgi:hypothetical protein
LVRKVERTGVGMGLTENTTDEDEECVVAVAEFPGFENFCGESHG